MKLLLNTLKFNLPEISINNKSESNINNIFEACWVILQNYYLHFPEKTKIYISKNNIVTNFNLNLSYDNSIVYFINEYSKLRMNTHNNDTLGLGSSMNSVIFFDKSLITKLQEIHEHNFLFSFFINENIAQIHYNRTFFNEQSINHVANLFKKIVFFIKNNLNITIKDLFNKLTPINATKCFMAPKPYTLPEKDIIDIIKQQCAIKKNKAAVSDPDTTLTYNELLKKFTSLSNKFKSFNITANSRIGLLLSRTYRLVVSMLAILDLRASFVPIDINMPKNRIEYIINDSELSLLLVDSEPTFDTKVPILNLNTNDYNAKTNTENTKNLKYSEESYLIYTSGSTGFPKGVSISRDSLNYYVKTAIKLYNIKENDSVLQFSSIGFDAMIEEIIPTLASGSSLVLRNDATVYNMTNLISTIKKHQITILNFPTSYWKSILNFKYINEALPSSIRLIIIGGESVTLKKLYKWKKYFQTTPKLINTYGPTETTVIATSLDVSEDLPALSCPIGKPIPGYTVLIIDPFGNVASPGVIGEIYIGGPGVAIGYTDPRKNDSFLKLNIKGINCNRFYKSGDFGRYTYNGHIEFIGRKDRQVKISGYRVSIQEIKNNIVSLDPLIEEIEIILHKDKETDSSILVAFIKCLKSSTNLENEIQKYLPKYMIPRIIYIDEIPKLISGKIDIKTLTNFLNQPQEKSNRKFDCKITEKIACIWKKILKTEINDIYKSFIDYGGSSIETIIMCNCVENELDIELNIHNHRPDELTINFIKNQFFNCFDQSEVKNTKNNNDILHERAFINELSKLKSKTYPINIQPDDNQNLYIFLTGATGFLGIHILNELLKNSKIKYVYCLVRSDNYNNSVNKLKNSANHYKISIDFQKIVVIKGDLGEENFGLENNEYKSLCEYRFHIINCAANVSMVSNYSYLKKDNIDSIENILKFSLRGTKKYLHHISSLAIFDSLSRSYDVDENTDLNICENFFNGYSKTKWGAEKLIQSANINAKIYRLGRVWGSLSTNIMPKNDIIFNFIDACIKVGSVPFLDEKLDILPVCFVSRIIVNFALESNNPLKKIFHISNPQPIFLNNIFQHLIKTEVINKISDYSKWRSDILSQLKKRPYDHPFAPIAFILKDDSYQSWGDTYIPCKHTSIYLKALGLEYPRLTNSIFDKFLKRNCLDAVENI